MKIDTKTRYSFPQFSIVVTTRYQLVPTKLANSLPQDTKCFPEVNKSSPQDNK